MNPNDTTAFVFLVVGVVAIVALIVRSRNRPAIGNSELAKLNERLARMEQAIDAMAVETERISEGQRFTTRLLSEKAKEPAPKN
jgi:FtsZ-interacting cell division protein ZipA